MRFSCAARIVSLERVSLIGLETRGYSLCRSAARFKPLCLGCIVSNSAAEEVSGRNSSWQPNLWLLSHPSHRTQTSITLGFLSSKVLHQKTPLLDFSSSAELSATLSFVSPESPPSVLRALGQGSEPLGLWCRRGNFGQPESCGW